MEEWRARLERVAASLRCTRAEAAALVVLLAGTLAGLGLVWWLAQPGSAPPDEARGAAVDAQAEPEGEDDGEGAAFVEEGGDAVLVHVAGEVADPGLVEVPAGARVADAIDAAGGPADDADLSGVNLARIVRDGEQILVGDGAEGDGGAVGPDGRVDVNRADADALQEVPGIGPVTAERIISHRETHGSFTAEQDLLAVPGIGERTLDQLMEHLRW